MQNNSIADESSGNVVATPATGEILSFSGATPTLTTIPTERDVKVYAVLESDLKHISLLNGLTTFFASAGSFVAAIVVSIVVSWGTNAGEITERGQVFLQVVSPGCAVLCLILYGLAIWAYCVRRSEWNKIGVSSKIPKK